MKQVNLLRQLIRETVKTLNESPDIVVDLDAALASFAMRGKDLVNLPLVANVSSGGKTYRIEVRTGGSGYEGFVDYGNFGGGKTVRAALSAIKRRLVYLSTEQPQKRADPGTIEAKMADEELRRREKRGF